MQTVYLPLVGAGSKPIPFGYALYGVTHARMHEEMAKRIPVQNWTATTCCLKQPTYYPTIHGTLWMQNYDEYRRMAAQFPKRTWLLLNEPDNGPPQAFIRPDYAIRLVKSWLEVLRPYDHRIAGYGVTITQPDHWLNRTSHPWLVTGWKKWLDEWNRLKGPIPDVAHVHIYAKTKQAWQDQYAAWRAWNQANWQRPTIISECGESEEVWAYLRSEFSDSNVEALLWFTNFTDNPLPGLPPPPAGLEPTVVTGPPASAPFA